MVKFAKKNPSSLKDEVIPSAFLIYSTQIFSLRTLSHIGAEDQQQIIEKKISSLCSRRSTTVSKPACSKLNSNFFFCLARIICDHVSVQPKRRFPFLFLEKRRKLVIKVWKFKKILKTRFSLLAPSYVEKCWSANVV